MAQENDYPKNMIDRNTLVFWGVVIVIGWLIIKQFFTVSIPGHWNEKASYETQIYVNLFPNNSDSKNYRLIGDLQKDFQCDGSDDNDVCWNTYYVSRITFPNLGYIEFDECDVKLYEKVSCIDTHNTTWDVELTDQRPR